MNCGTGLKTIIGILCIMLCVSFSLYGQGTSLSDRQTWNDPDMSDSVRIDALRQLIWKEYLFVRPDSALILGEQLLSFSEGVDSPEGRAQAYNILGIANDFLGNLDAAINYQLSYLEISQELNDTLGMGYAFNNLGIVYRKKAEYQKAAEYLEQALVIDRAKKDTAGIVSGLINLGHIYYQQGKFSTALDLFERGLVLGASTPNKSHYATLLQGVGLIYFSQKDHARATDYYKRALQIFEEANDPGGQLQALNSLGNNYDSQGILDSALIMYTQAAELAKEMHDVRSSASIALNLGILYMNLEQYDDAAKSLQAGINSTYKMGARHLIAAGVAQYGINLAKQGNHSAAVDSCSKALALAEEFDMIKDQESACSCLYVSYRALGDNANALRYFEKLERVQDSIHTRELVGQLERLEFRKQVVEDSIKRQEELFGIQASHEKEVSRYNNSRNLAYAGGVLLFIIALVLIRRNKDIWRSKKAAEEEQRKSDDLLFNVLPPAIAKELKEHGKTEPREFAEVTVLFTDFVKFTEASANLLPKALLTEINVCFAAFDDICEKYGVEKIKTIGDAYMAAGGLPVPSSEDAANVVSAALDMQKFITSRRSNTPETTFEMRVGIHSGPVVAGIVGSKKLQYDIWGDTVNAASRMESHGESGQVNISESTYKLIRDQAQFAFQERNVEEVKGLGPTQMYLVKLR